MIIVTQSGSNQWHGAAYEFLRNNALDAPNFFDQGSAPPFQRNQFGASVGGPIQPDKTFLFADYEGFRQNLHQTSAAFVPDAASRAAAAASVQPLLESVACHASRRARFQWNRASLQQPAANYTRRFWNRPARPHFFAEGFASGDLHG